MKYVPIAFLLYLIYQAVLRGDNQLKMSDINAPRGIRNNNAGNIRYVASNSWLGQVGHDADGFVIFDTPHNGIRAMARIIRNYMRSYNLHTVTAIIARYAPPNENDTAMYAATVAGKMGISPHELITEDDILPLVTNMIFMENGVMPYNAALVKNAVAEGIA